MESRANWQAKLDRMRRNARAKAKTAGISDEVRSGLELNVSILLKHLKVAYEFESETIPWVSEPEKHKYTPDFKIQTSSGKIIFIETKGRFELSDRKKHLWIKKQHPDLDIRFIFSNPNTWDRKAKTRSYAKWAEANGFKWCGKAQMARAIQAWSQE